MGSVILIDEQRLGDLYAAGEISIEQLELSLDIINHRRQAAEQPRASRAGEPLTREQKQRLLDHRPSEAPRRREPLRYCPNCRQAVSGFDERTMTATCRSCGPVSLNPYGSAQQTASPGGGVAVGLFITGPIDLFEQPLPQRRDAG